jgi:hypothetical protein
VSVSVLAPDAARASRRRPSSMCNVFFIQTKIPYAYGCRRAFVFFLASAVEAT